MTAGRIWPAVIAGALFALGAVLLWWPAVDDLATRGPAASAEDPVAARAAAVHPVDDYLAFADRLRASPASTDEVIVEGVRKLAGALGTVEGVEPDVPIDLRVVAEHILLNAASQETTAAVRASLAAAADSLDRNRGGGPEVRPAVDAIDDRVPLTEQRDRLTAVLVLSADRIRQARRRVAQDVS